MKSSVRGNSQKYYTQDTHNPASSPVFTHRVVFNLVAGQLSALIGLAAFSERIILNQRERKYVYTHINMYFASMMRSFVSCYE